MFVNQNTGDFLDESKLPKKETVSSNFCERVGQKRLHSSNSEKKSEHNEDAQTERSFTRNAEMLSFCVDIDYKKLKMDLHEGAVEKRLLILQALRWVRFNPSKSVVILKFVAF